MKLSLPATVTKVTTMRDKTVRIQVDCQESAPEHMAELFALNDKLGWFFFHEKPIKEIDTKDLPEIKLEKWEKSPSQRLRATMFCYWEQTKPDMPFEAFYRTEMEKIIDYLKTKLDQKV